MANFTNLPSLPTSLKMLLQEQPSALINQEDKEAFLANRKSYFISASKMAVLWTCTGNIPQDAKYYDTLKYFLEVRAGLRPEKKHDEFALKMFKKGEEGEDKMLAELFSSLPKGIGLAQTGTFEKLHKGLLYGASPDSVVWCGQLVLPVEIKTHVMLPEVPYEMKTLHWVQLQFQMWVLGAKYGLWVGYCPNAENQDAEPPSTHRRITLYKYCEPIINWLLERCAHLEKFDRAVAVLKGEMAVCDLRRVHMNAIVSEILKDSRSEVAKIDWSWVKNSRVKTADMDVASLRPFANTLRTLDAAEAAPLLIGNY